MSGGGQCAARIGHSLKYACDRASPAVRRSYWSYRSSLSSRSMTSAVTFGLLSVVTNRVHDTLGCLHKAHEHEHDGIATQARHDERGLTVPAGWDCRYG